MSADTQSLPTFSVFPREIEFLVLDQALEVTMKETALSCSLVCKAWRQVLLQPLFKTVKVQLALPSRHMDVLLQLLISPSPVLPHIQELIINQGNPSPPYMAAKLPLSELAEALDLLPQLQTLYLTEVLLPLERLPVPPIKARFQLHRLVLGHIWTECLESNTGYVDNSFAIRILLQMFSNISELFLDSCILSIRETSEDPIRIDGLDVDDEAAKPSVANFTIGKFAESGWTQFIPRWINLTYPASLIAQRSASVSMSLRDIIRGGAESIVHLDVKFRKGISDPISLPYLVNLRTLVIRVISPFLTEVATAIWPFLYEVLDIIPASIATLTLYVYIPHAEKPATSDFFDELDLRRITARLRALRGSGLRSFEFKLMNGNSVGWYLSGPGVRAADLDEGTLAQWKLQEEAMMAYLQSEEKELSINVSLIPRDVPEYQTIVY